MLLRLFISCLLVFSLVKSHAQYSGRDTIKLSPDQLKTDLMYFKVVLEKAHPSLYEYISKDSLNQRFLTAYEKLDHPRSHNEFWVLLQGIAATIGCGHTYFSPISFTYNNSKQNEYSFLPFYIAVENNRLFVQRYIYSPKMPYRIGDEILTINGDSSHIILKKLRSLISGDGTTNSYRDYRIERGDFNWLYGLVNKPVPEFVIEFRRNGNSLKMNVRAVPDAVSLKSKAAVDTTIHSSLFYPPNMPSAAVFRINDFKGNGYLKSHKNIFDELKERNINNLIIDLRNNPGGRSEIAIDMMKYLVPNEFYFSRYTEGIVDAISFSKLFESYKSPELSILRAFPNVSYTREFSVNKAQKPYKKRFRGKVYILINGGTFSSAALTAVALKEQLNCIVIGEETGGGHSGCNGGKTVKVALPQSLIKLNLPLAWTNSVSVTPNAGKGLVPDYVIKSNPLRISESSYMLLDPALAKVRELVNSIIPPANIAK